MKNWKKTCIVGLSAVIAMSFSMVNVSAATSSDGLSAQINITSQKDSSCEVDAQLDNTNYYGIDGISVHLSVSDNAEITGDTEKSDFSLAGESSDKLKATVIVTDDSSQTSSSQSDSSSQTESSLTDSSSEPINESSSSISTPPSGSITLDNNTSKNDASPNTGSDKNSLSIALLIVLLLLGAVAVTVCVKKRDKRLFSFFLSLVLVVSIADVSAFAANSNDDDNENLVKSFTETCEIEIGHQTVIVTMTVEYPAQAEIHDNSIEDMKKLNGGDVDITYNQKEEISFLNAKFTDYKITNQQTAINSISAVKTVLGLSDKQISVLPYNTKTIDNGDVYYTFKQNVGAVMLSTSFITIGADKDGNALCISNSLNLTAQAEDMSENMITAEQAKQIIKDMYKSTDNDFADVESELDYNLDSTSGNSSLCWVFYLKDDNVDYDNEIKQNYLKIYVSARDGQIMSMKLVSSIKDSSNYNDADRNNAFFNIETTMMEFTDYKGNKVSLPVAQAEDGSYFLCDKQRKMVGVDSDKCVLASTPLVVPYTFDSPEELSSIFGQYL